MAIDPDALASSLRRLATLGQPGSSVVEGLRHVTEARGPFRRERQRHHAGR